ncbi:hypothetical protein wVul_0855 [Wolbachia endosymbiont of Armadillidium vulgare str. wVulC]|uniref:hypothetical protein n=1 Tax=Wolbachia endosymbiont of Armadillidium vulgare TaxID=77039 RepID=UPI0006D4C43B|nr:hypothetical protein [Wolbachia endosymbiont of Armadillidium vulgare]KLT22490.1 hypothetical protein wVul_0855 [Wolbachia endosymbiont of Armadillidium vulgare str. wVulC]
MFGSKSKSKFMLSIGEEGIMLLYFKNNTLNKRYFVKGKNDKAVSDLISCLSSDKKAPLYLVLNRADQNYSLQFITRANKISAYLSAKTKMEHFSRNNDISSVFLVEKPNKFNQNWCYLLVSSKAKHLVEYWLNVFIEIGSNFKGILMFPIEISNITKKILHKDPSNWKIIVAATKTGGYRQVVLKENKMVFTRLVPFTNDNLPGIIAGGIYQEVQDTIRSLTKFGFEKNNPIDLCIIVSEDIKASLSVINFSENSVNILTPYELGKLLGAELAISEKDNFCDTIILFHSFKNKLAAIFNTKETKEFYLFNYLYLNSSRIFLHFALVLVVINALCLLNLYSNFNVADNLSAKQSILNNQLIKLSKSYNVKKIDEIYDFININNILLKIEYSPLTQVKYVEKLKVPGIELRSFEWNYNEAKSYITTTLRFNFQSGKNISYQYEKLRKSLNDNFRTYDISISSLPTAKGQNLSIDVEIGEAM